MTTPMYWVSNDICYQGATLNKYVHAAAIPDSRQCAGPEIRGQGGVVGTCDQAGWTAQKPTIKVDTCHLGPIPFGVWEKSQPSLLILVI